MKIVGHTLNSLKNLKNFRNHQYVQQHNQIQIEIMKSNNYSAFTILNEYIRQSQ